MAALLSAQAKLLQQQQCARAFSLLDRHASADAERECKRLLGGGPVQLVEAPPGAGAAPGEKVELTPARVVQLFPLAEALLSFAYMQGQKHVLALSVALRMKQEGWGSSDHQVSVPLASVFRHYRKYSEAAELVERTFHFNKENEALAQEVFDAFLTAQNYQRAQTFAMEMHRLFGSASSTAPKTAAPAAAPKRPRGTVRKGGPSSGKAKNSSDRYFWWSMTCHLLCNFSNPQMGQKLSLPLAEGMIRKHVSLDTLLDSTTSNQPPGERQQAAPFFTGTPAELEKYQVVLAVLNKQSKWDVAYQLLETPAGRAHAGLPAGPLFHKDDKPADAPLPDYLGETKLPRSAQAQAQQEAGILGNIDLRETRWETMRQLGKWSELVEELTWRFLHGDHDWSTLKSLISASIQRGPNSVATVLSLLEKSLPAQTPSVGSEETPGSLSSLHAQQPTEASQSVASSAKKNKKKRAQANKKKNALVKERGLFLARLELIRQWHASSTPKGLPSDAPPTPEVAETLTRLSLVDMGHLIQEYFDAFSTKPCAYEDLLPYLPTLSPTDQTNLRDKFLAGHVGPDRQAALDEERGLYTYMNAIKLRSALRSYPSSSEASPEAIQAAQAALLSDAEQYWAAYDLGLRAGKHLPSTEMQPADDLAYMTAEALVVAWHLSKTGPHGRGNPEYLLAAAQVLGKALIASPKGYKLRLLLIRISVVLGAFSLARTHYDLLGIRYIQQDSMAHWLLERSGLFSSLDVPVQQEANDTPTTALGGPLQRALDSTKGTYEENIKHTPLYLAQCFEFGNYSRAQELLDFYMAVESSLSRTLNRTEELMLQVSLNLDRSVLVQTASSIVATPPSVVAKHDQRDRSLLPTFLPGTAVPAVEALRSGPRPNAGYAHALASAVLSALGDRATSGSESVQEDVSTLTPLEEKVVQFWRSPTVDMAQLRTWVASLVPEADRCTTPLDLLHLANVVLRAYRIAQLQRAPLETEDTAVLTQLAEQIDRSADELLQQMSESKKMDWLPGPNGPAVAASIAASRTATSQAAAVLRSLVRAP